MARYEPQFDLTDLDWTTGRLRVVKDGEITILLFIETGYNILYVLDVKGVEE